MKRLLDPWETVFQELYIAKGGIFIFNSLTKEKENSLYPESNSDSYEFDSGYKVTQEEQVEQINPDLYLESMWRILPPFIGNSTLQQAMKFHLKALLKIKNLSEKNKFKFTYVFIYTGLPYDDLFLHILKIFCENNKINFLNMKSIFENAQINGDEIFLPRDGHFTSQGAYVTAEALARIHSLPDGSGTKK